MCSDIAVGAPYDGDGKVFIYRGSDSGIETKPAQVSYMLHLTNEQRARRKDEKRDQGNKLIMTLNE